MRRFLLCDDRRIWQIIGTAVMDCSARHDATVEQLIARSGIISRQILKLYRFMRQSGSTETASHGVGNLWLRQDKVRRTLSGIGISKLADLLYTYYLGGSLTRQDQLTFARIHGLANRAYLLTGVNALACGIPTAMTYFLVGEGFSLLSRLHSYTELPALLVSHTSLWIGVVSLAVDLFRAVDSFWHRRCWAPFGILPFAINLPTYLKIGARKLQTKKARSQPGWCKDPAVRQRSLRRSVVD
jgi:hypothetical protein